MEVNELSEIYRHALTEALQIPCKLDDAMMQRVHQDILQDLRRSANDLINSGVFTAEEVSMELDFKVGPILEEAKSVNRKRVYAFVGYSTSGRYTFGLTGDYTIISGRNNDDVISDIRNWLCDFGTRHDKFGPDIWGHWSCVGEVVENVRSSLTVAGLLPRILTENITSPEMPEPNASDKGTWNAAYYIQVHPIKMNFYFHNPTEVTGEMKIKSRNVSYKLKGHDITLRAPVVQPVNTLQATFAAEIEYEVSKRVYARMWSKILTFGITNAFDNEKSTTFVHKMKIKMSLDPAELKLREKLNITVSKEAADRFLKAYKAFQEMGPALAGNKTPEAIANSEFLLLCQSQPWVEFIQAMRDGGVKAAMEMIHKKPDILMNLPVNQNNVAGVAFEELQIAKIMAEAVRLKVPLTLIEGDGRGAFTYEGRPLHTPEYVDAVFHNEATNEYFAVQFKYSDKPENLVEMMTQWMATHRNRQPGNIPEAMELDNVQLIGPRDISDHADTRMFREKIRVGFEMRPENTASLKQFLHENKEFFVKFLEDYKPQLDRTKELRSEIKGLNKRSETKKSSLQQAEHERAILLAEEPNANTKIRNIDRRIDGTKKGLADTQADLTVKNQELGEIHDTLRSKIKKELVPYKTGLPVKALLKTVAIGAAVGAAVDGIITLVVSCDNEIRRCYRGEITIGRCVWEITKQTGVGAVRGAGIAGAFSGMNALSQYATMAGWSSASALTFAANVAGPVLLVGTLGYQTYAIMDKYRSGDLTTAQMEKAFARTASTTTLSTAGMIGAACLIGGPAGLVVGAGLAISVGIADHFLGDKIWSIFIKEDIKALEAVVKRKRRDVTELVLKAGYELFDLSEYATDEELRESYRAAILKYHPDKGGNAEIFAAVHAAYTLICEHRKESLYQ